MSLIGPVLCKGKYGYLSWGGDWAIEPRFEGANRFSEGLAGVIENGKLGFINKAGEIVIDAIFEVETYYIPSFREKLSAVSQGGASGYIGKSGDWQIRPQPNKCLWQFKEGRAINADNGRYYVIDTMGKKLSDLPVADVPFADDWPKSWDWFPASFEHGTYLVGAVNWRGEIMLEPRYRSLGFLYENVASFSLVHYLEGPFGLIRSTGEVIMEEKLLSIGPFSDGLAAASVEKKKFGFINPAGDFVIEPRFLQASQFSEGLACVSLPGMKGQRGNKGFINAKGEMVIEPRFIRQGHFQDGWAWVEYEDKAGVIDRSGRLVWELPLYDVQ